MTKLSPLKQKLMNMSDEDIIRLLKNTNHEKTPKIAAACWFDEDKCGLTPDGKKLLAEMEKQINIAGKTCERKQLRYLHQLSKMRLKDCIPASFYNFSDYKEFYRRLHSFCMENDIPSEIISAVIPSITTYIKTGHIRPILFTGEKGCGKTTAVRMLVEEALGMPTEVIKVSQLSGGRGLTGDSGSYQSADVGRLMNARLRNNSMLVAYIFDEIDKVVQTTSNENTAEALLPVTDESVATIYDEFVQDNIVGLEHCPMFFTANDIKKVNPILLDRMQVIHFPEADSTRIKSIMQKYVKTQFESNDLYAKYVRFDFEMLNNTIDILLNRYGIHSLRKHQQLVEHVYGEALDAAFTKEDNAIVEVSNEMFQHALLAVAGSERRKLGF